MVGKAFFFLEISKIYIIFRENMDWLRSRLKQDNLNYNEWLILLTKVTDNHNFLLVLTVEKSKLYHPSLSPLSSPSPVLACHVP